MLDPGSQGLRDPQDSGLCTRPDVRSLINLAEGSHVVLKMVRHLHSAVRATALLEQGNKPKWGSHPVPPELRTKGMLSRLGDALTGKDPSEPAEKVIAAT